VKVMVVEGSLDEVLSVLQEYTSGKSNKSGSGGEGGGDLPDGDGTTDHSGSGDDSSENATGLKNGHNKISVIGLNTRPEDFVALSAREKTILSLIMGGSTNQEIATALDIAYPTVKTHIHNLLTKIGVRNRAQAAMWGQLNPAMIGPVVVLEVDAR
jgi:DNA-binding CsgD family transcriptional regulator